MDPGARAAPLVAWLWPVLLAPDPEAPLPPTPEPLPVLEMVAEPARSIRAVEMVTHEPDPEFCLALLGVVQVLTPAVATRPSEKRYYRPRWGLQVCSSSLTR